MPDSSQLIAAAADPDLRARLVALLAATGHTSPAATIETRIGELVAAPVGGGQCIADVHAYAVATRAQAIDARTAAITQAEQAHPIAGPPGANLAAVTDTHLAAALTTLGIIATP